MNEEDNVEEVVEALSPLSLREGAYQLKICHALPRESGDGLWVIVQFFVFDGPPPDGSIRDVLEQQLALAPGFAEDLARLRAFAEGWARVLREAFQRDLDKDGVPMPHELLCDFRPLALKRAATADDFAEAARAKSRLGAFLR